MNKLSRLKKLLRPPRFSLRIATLGITFLAVWMGAKVQNAREQMAVVRLVLEKEGQVIYDVEVAECYWDELTTSPKLDPV